MATRREFMQNGLGLVSLGLAMPQALVRAAQAQFAPLQSAAPVSVLPGVSGGKILVVLEMTGGNDGLNTVVPYADPAYARSRPNIGLKSTDVLKIDNKLGLHPAMQSLGALFEKGQVAIVNGVGYANPSRSHFDAMDVWQSGDPKPKLRDRSGWLARYFDVDGHYKANPLSGIVMGGQVPLALEEQNRQISLFGSERAFVFDNNEGQSPMQTLHTLYQRGAVGNGNVEFISTTSSDVYTSVPDVGTRLQNYDCQAGKAAKYPLSTLAQNLQSIAGIINSGVGTRVFYASLGGFDTHANQPQNHAHSLGIASEAIAAFYRDLAFQGRDKDVLLLTFSEFGRRVQENHLAGTDHGAASCLFLVGGAVRGGTFGEYPSLTDLDDGDLRFTVDFRRVYSTIIEKWLGANSGPILNGNYEPLNFL